MVIFAKMTKNSGQHQNTGGFIILQKLCKILEKKFLANLTNFWPRWTGCTQFPIFDRYPRKLMINNKKTSQNLWKMGPISRRNLPGKNWSFLQKWQKIVFTIKIRGVSLFCKNCVKFSKKIFWQIWPIFDLGGHVVHNSPFLLITPVNWWQTTKKQVKICEKWVPFPDVTSPGKIGHFCKNDKK